MRVPLFLIAFLLVSTANSQFVTTAQKTKITPSEKASVVEGLADIMGKGYVEKEKGEAVKQLLLSNLKEKKYKSVETCEELIARLISDTQSVIQDKHFHIMFFPKSTGGFNWTNEGEKESDESRKREEELNFERHKTLNFGLPKIEVLDGNVGYLKVSWFNSPAKWFKEPLAHAFDFLRNTDCLILDVRNNPGGQEETVTALADYFFEENSPVLLSTSHQKLSGKQEAFYTDPIPAGSKYLNKKVYVLTSSSTGSGGEMIAYHFKHFKKGTLIGETTSGAANGFNTVKLGAESIGNIMVLVPDTYTKHAVTKSNWEKVGVMPDIATKSDDALWVAYKEAIAGLREAATSTEKKRAYEQLLTSAEFKYKPGNTRPDIQIRDYIGKYDIRTISEEDGQLFFQRDNSSKIRMQYLGNDTFELDTTMTPKPVLKFNRENGIVTSFDMSAPGGNVSARKNP